MNPKIKFKIDQSCDLRSLKAFIKESRLDNGRNLEWAIFKKHPALRSSIKRNSADYSFLKKYIARQYQVNAPDISKKFNRHEADWLKCEQRFFGLVEDLFPGGAWPRGRYIAYATIWGMFPRFLEDKTFQIPIQHRSRKYISVIIAHELLHFIFYEYVRRHYHHYKDPYHSFFVWHISEIFNSLVQDSPSWLAVFKKKTMPYPEHQKIIAQIRKKFPDPTVLKADGLIEEIEPLVKKMMGE